MKSRIIGAVILLVIIAAALGIYFYQGGGKPQITLNGLIGGEKEGFLNNPDVENILKRNYGITLDFSKRGSVEMVENDEDSDFLFPSSEIALEYFKETKGSKLLKSDTIFNSPIVLYSWGPVTDALEKQGIVQKKGDSYYIVDLPKLLDLVVTGKKWSDIGLDLYGKINIISTDPLKSNSGNIFYGLMANMLNNSDIVDESSVDKVIPTLKKIYTNLGYLEDSSSKLFESYLNKGMGENPIIVGYENQAIEFAAQNPEVWNRAKDTIRILYPEPTVWSSHQLIILNKGDQTKNGASELITALKDEKLQQIAWEKHGFRPGIVSAQIDTTKVPVKGIPQTIDKVMKLPKENVMKKIMDGLTSAF